METFYYNLSGGINQSTTKTELGLNTKIYIGQILKISKFFKIKVLSDKKVISY